jgi:triosephosphate isomerase
MKYIIANWKANKTFSESKDWITSFTSLLKAEASLMDALTQKNIAIIICPPDVYLPLLSSQLPDLPNVYIGAQNVSAFEKGAYTGETTAIHLRDFATYTLVGHSERRSNFGETDDIVSLKIQMAQAQSIIPIHCVRGIQDALFDGVPLIAYEPVEAIGTGNNMPADEVVQKKRELKIPETALFIYGGSVNQQSCGEYLRKPEIDGLLVGGASLLPDSFLGIVRSAISI